MFTIHICIPITYVYMILYDMIFYMILYDKKIKPFKVLILVFFYNVQYNVE